MLSETISNIVAMVTYMEWYRHVVSFSVLTSRLLKSNILKFVSTKQNRISDARINLNIPY